MTHGEMVEEVTKARADGHEIKFNRNHEGDGFACTYNGQRHVGGDQITAYLAAKAAAATPPEHEKAAEPAPPIAKKK